MTRTRSLLPSSYRSLLAAVALATGVAACGGDDDGSRSTTSSLSAAASDGPAPPAEPVTIRMGWGVPAEEIKYLMMQRPELAAHLGTSYEIEWHQFAGTPPGVQGLAAGTLDCATVGGLSVANGLEKGADKPPDASVAPRPMIEANGLVQVFRNRQDEVAAIGGVDLDVARGSLVAVLGPSGCGKSTLLHLLAGFVAPTAGTIVVDGRLVRGPDPQRGVVFQDAALFPWRTVLGNVEFGLQQLGVPRSERRARARRMLELVRLDGVERLHPRELSGGMRQRVALARALATEPAVLLMDEPFGALDALTRAQLQDELVGVWARTAQTIVFVTHAVDEALYLADEVVVLSGRPATVRARVVVDLPRPRRREDLVGTARYAELHRRLIAALTGSGEAPCAAP